jgi:hypothetical protein
LLLSVASFAAAAPGLVRIAQEGQVLPVYDHIVIMWEENKD